MTYLKSILCAAMIRHVLTNKPPTQLLPNHRIVVNHGSSAIRSLIKQPRRRKQTSYQDQSKFNNLF
jgi:hypothetical protein